MKAPAKGPPRSKAPLAAIKLGSSDRSVLETRYGRYLVWFMRLVAVLLIGQGLSHWFAVLATDNDPQGALGTTSTLGTAAVAFFSVIDLVAAVGLWLAAAWGGVVWLVAVAGRWLAILVLPHFFDYDMPIGMTDLALVFAYLYLTYRAAQENEPYV